MTSQSIRTIHDFLSLNFRKQIQPGSAGCRVRVIESCGRITKTSKSPRDHSRFATGSAFPKRTHIFIASREALSREKWQRCHNIGNDTNIVSASLPIIRNWRTG